MWLSRQMKPAMPTADADLGVTTIAGEQAGVVTRGEVRALPGLWSRGICLAAGKRHGRIGDQGWPRRRGAVRHSRPAVRSGGPCSPARSISTAQAGMPYTCAGTGQ